MVIYESLTGHTRFVAERAAAELEQNGIEAMVCPATNVDLQWLSQSELVLVGSWVDGIFVIGQRPGRASRLHNLPAMANKRCAVFCTFALNPGKVIEKLTAIMEAHGAEVIGGMAIRRDDLEGGAIDMANRVLDAIAVAPPAVTPTPAS
jgi:sulfite reductase alpha subunit-like flavoprotein